MTKFFSFKKAVLFAYGNWVYVVINLKTSVILICLSLGYISKARIISGLQNIIKIALSVNIYLYLT